MNNRGRYTARITTQTPSAFVFMIDQSGSMEEKLMFDGELMSKAEAVALIVNDIIQEIINRCKRDVGYKDYFDVAVLGYRGENKVESLLGKGNTDNYFRKVSELATMKTEIERRNKLRVLPDGREVVITSERKRWVKPMCSGKTPMGAAMKLVNRLLNVWVLRCADKRCFPPIVINITDGEATDVTNSELEEMAGRVKSISTAEGNVLMLNIHISSDNKGEGILFPSDESRFEDKTYARLLYRMSSVMPEPYHCHISELVGRREVNGCKAMSYNSSMIQLVGMLSIGSVSVSFLD